MWRFVGVASQSSCCKKHFLRAAAVRWRRELQRRKPATHRPKPERNRHRVTTPKPRPLSQLCKLHAHTLSFMKSSFTHSVTNTAVKKHTGSVHIGVNPCLHRRRLPPLLISSEHSAAILRSYNVTAARFRFCCSLRGDTTALHWFSGYDHVSVWKGNDNIHLSFRKQVL